MLKLQVARRGTAKPIGESARRGGYQCRPQEGVCL